MQSVAFRPLCLLRRRSRPPSRRSVSDTQLKAAIKRVYDDNFKVYGSEKIWRQLQREGIACGRDRVARLMRELGIVGATRGKPRRTTVPADRAERPGDLVGRHFAAPAPNRVWVADITYVRTASGFAYVAFVTDVYARMIVGWAVSASLKADLAISALEMAIFARAGQDLSGLVHHSDRGVQYLSVRYTERVDQAQAVTSVGSKGDSFDNALAETVNGLYKAELVHHFGPWRNTSHIELATAAWVSWWNNARLHSWCGYVPPAEHEAAWRTSRAGAEEAA